MDRALALFAENVRRLLRERDMTERALALKMEMAPAQFNRYMHGQMCELGVITRVAAALGVEPAELLMTDADRAGRPLAEHAIEECLRRIAEAAGITPEYHPISDEEWEDIERAISPEGVDELRRILDQPARRARSKAKR